MQPIELLKTLSTLTIKGQQNLHKKLKLCNLTLLPEDCHTAEEVAAKVRAFKPTQGWLCFQSEVKYFCKEEPMPYSGILLYGEVINADGKSLHIRENGQGGWILTTFTETQGENYLVESKAFLGEKELAPESVYYHVYWKYDEKSGYQQFAARFIGFEKPEK